MGASIAMLGYFTNALSGLSFQGVLVLAVLAMSIVWWVARIFPEYVTALVMVVLFIAICGVPTETALSSFASSTWWLLLAAYALGFGMQDTGLMERIANAILRICPRTFRMQSAGLIAAGTLIGPLIPSLSAKAAMLAPLSMGISDSMGYERKSKQATGLFLAMFTGIRTIGPAVISASIIGYGLVALLPADTAAEFDMLHWFLGMAPWFAIATVLNYIAIVTIYGPKGKDRQLEAEASKSHAIEKSMAKDARSSLSAPMSSAEKRLAWIMCACILLWITEPLHAIPSHIVAIGAMLAMLITNVVTSKEMLHGVSWSSLIFIGCVLGLASVFAYYGIDEWIVQSCGPAFQALAANPYMFIFGICIITILLRFVIVSEMAYINIFMAFMVPMVLTLGISPWVIGVSVYAVVNPWFVLYQNPIYMTAYYATDGQMADHGALAKYCAVYLGICIIGLLANIPYWQSLGLI